MLSNIDRDRYEFEENEVVLCVESMLLGDRRRNDKFLVVGTSVNRGEDMSGRGKVSVLWPPKPVIYSADTFSRRFTYLRSCKWSRKACQIERIGVCASSARKRPKSR